MNPHVQVIQSFAKLVETRRDLFSEEEGVAKQNLSDLINRITTIITDRNVDDNLGNNKLGNTISEWCEDHSRINEALDNLIATKKGPGGGRPDPQAEEKSFRDYGNTIINTLRTSKKNDQKPEHPKDS